MAYTDKDALKIYLKIDSSNTDDDALLTTLIGRAQAMIDRRCGQSFEASTDSTRFLSALPVLAGGAREGRDLILDAPLCAITSVTNGDGVVVAGADYLTLPYNGTPYYALRLKASSGLSWTYDTDAESDLIAIVGRWAYSEEAPDDIVQACTRLAAYLYRQRETTLETDRVINTGNAIYAPVSIPSDIVTILTPYVRAI